MGCAAAVPSYYSYIPNRYGNLDQATSAVRSAGLKELQVIIGVDFTRSNLDHGTWSFEGRSLHDVHRKKERNPYQQAFSLIDESFEESIAGATVGSELHVYGFGDSQTGSTFVFSFQPADERGDDRPCQGFQAFRERYLEIADAVALGGPTSFAPIIRQAIHNIRLARPYRERSLFHILLLVADGEVSQSDRLETEIAIQEASCYPLSIVCIGLGDGPWDMMEKYDNRLRRRHFDNFQLVEFNAVFARYPFLRRADAFATHALQQVPSQYRACRALGYFNKDWQPPRDYKVPPKPFGPPDDPNPGDPLDKVVQGWTAVWHHTEHKHFYMCKETGEAWWNKPVDLHGDQPARVTSPNRKVSLLSLPMLEDY